MIKLELKLNTLDVKATMQKIGQSLIDKIKKNIQDGKNNEGVSFQPYSPSYKKSGKVTLSDTGLMLSNLKVAVTDKDISILVEGDRGEIAEYLNAHKNWTFLEWGKTLDFIYTEYLEYIVKETLDEGAK